jgi:hypothetical protein
VSATSTRVQQFQSRLLSRLVRDTVDCLQLAYADIDYQRKVDARNAVMTLNTTDVTDLETAISTLRVVRRHLRVIEMNLNAADRPLTAAKVRDVLQRVEHMTQK